MGPVWDIDGDLGSAQLGEGLGIKDKEESAFLLETEKIKKCYVKKKRSRTTFLTIMMVKVLNHFSPCQIRYNVSIRVMLSLLALIPSFCFSSRLLLVLLLLTYFSGCYDDWQNHSIIFLSCFGRSNKDRLRREQAGMTPHLDRKDYINISLFTLSCFMLGNRLSTYCPHSVIEKTAVEITLMW